MKIKKICAILCAAVCTAVYEAPVSTADCADRIKIMSVGDSITDGYGTDGSYRKFMYNRLTNSGYDIDMVGPQWSYVDSASYSGDGESFEYDPNHCGYSGYAIKEIPGRNGILETLQSGNYLSQCSPDIVILQIGTNDVIDNYEFD